MIGYSIILINQKMVEKVHGEQNRVNHRKGHRKTVSEAVVRSDPALGPTIEKTNSTYFVL